MDCNEYMKQRLETSREWYSRNSHNSKNWHNLLQMVQIVSAACIPFLPSVIDQGATLNIATGGLGVLIAMVTGIAALFRFDEKWTRYRTTSESLKHERYLYLTQTRPYDGSNPFPLLVQRVESMISQENSNWSEYIIDGGSSNPVGA